MEKNILNKIFPPSSNSKDLGYDNEGLWSITLPQDADTISQIILNESNSDITIFDGTAGLGGNTISFAKYFKNVIAVEMNKDRFMLLQNNIKLIDLAADFRLQNPETFNEWYAPLKSVKSEILKQAVYGLTEWNRDKIKSAKIIANPGCYPTATALAIIPLLQNNLIDNSVFIIDAKSGTTGAGRKAEQSLLFSEVQESFSAYKPLLHRHIPEIEQTLINFGSQGHLPDIKIRFTPHLLPIKRGILNTIYLKPNPNISKNKINSLLQETLSEAYKTEFFVNIVPEPPKTKDVYGTNKCHIFATYDERTDLIVLISVIDNLIKGAAGQAIQNANLLFDLPESMGLNSLGLLP